jgi:hypothetical protein
MNCFGRAWTEAGHSRVPAPPHMMTGTTSGLTTFATIGLVILSLDIRKGEKKLLDGKSTNFGRGVRL